MSKDEINFNQEFGDGTILDKSNEQLVKRLMALCTGPIPNEDVRHREIIRGITINHILLQRHTNKLNRQNTILQWVVIVLASISIITGIIQAYTTIKYSKEPQSYSMRQVIPKSEEAKSKSIQDQTTKADQTKSSSKPSNIYGK